MERGSARPVAAALVRIARAALRALRRTDGLARRALPGVRAAGGSRSPRLARGVAYDRARTRVVRGWKERGLRPIRRPRRRARRRGRRRGRRQTSSPISRPTATGASVAGTTRRSGSRGSWPRGGTSRRRRCSSELAPWAAGRPLPRGASPERARRVPSAAAGAASGRCRRRRLHHGSDRSRPRRRRSAQEGRDRVDVVTFARRRPLGSVRETIS